MHHPASSQWMRSFAWSRLRKSTAEDPLRLLSSACLLGHRVGWDDRAYTAPLALHLAGHPSVCSHHFCPEHLILGTPRLLTTIHHGNGFDVLDGKAQVKDSEGQDRTEAFLDSAQKMLAFAQQHRVEVALLMEISDSCGTSAIYLGDPAKKEYQQGPGVSASMLIRHGIPVVGSRDEKCLNAMLSLLNGGTGNPTESATNFREAPWYQEYFES